jgi:hypothetical protein
MTFFDEFSNPRQRIYTKTATSTDTGTLAVTIPASNVNAARMYAFSGVRATLPFLEGVATASDADGSLNGPTVTTTGANRLAVAFISLDTNQPMAPFTGELGGDWTEPVAEFLTDAGSNFGIQIQTATLATAGTLSGGQASFGNGPDASICRAFALIGN